MTTLADYIGRTVDVLAFQGQDPVKEALLIQALASEANGGQICSSIQKLAQRWLLEFLTVRGSMIFLPVRGSDFVLLARTGQLRTTVDGEQAFALASKQVETSLTAEEDDTMPDDERYALATLDTLTVAADKLTLSVTLLSRAGTARQVILPIDIKTVGF